MVAEGGTNLVAIKRQWRERVGGRERGGGGTNCMEDGGGMPRDGGEFGRGSWY